jgi:hypothetical protein
MIRLSVIRSSIRRNVTASFKRWRFGASQSSNWPVSAARFPATQSFPCHDAMADDWYEH